MLWICFPTGPTASCGYSPDGRIVGTVRLQHSPPILASRACLRIWALIGLKQCSTEKVAGALTDAISCSVGTWVPCMAWSYSPHSFRLGELAPDIDSRAPLWSPSRYPHRRYCYVHRRWTDVLRLPVMKFMSRRVMRISFIATHLTILCYFAVSLIQNTHQLLPPP
jgi:hypothetical protein